MNGPKVQHKITFFKKVKLKVYEKHKLFNKSLIAFSERSGSNDSFFSGESDRI